MVGPLRGIIWLIQQTITQNEGSIKAFPYKYTERKTTRRCRLMAYLVFQVFASEIFLGEKVQKLAN